jgi:hypothetical protein
MFLSQYYYLLVLFRMGAFEQARLSTPRGESDPNSKYEGLGYLAKGVVPRAPTPDVTRHDVLGVDLQGTIPNPKPVALIECPSEAPWFLADAMNSRRFLSLFIGASPQPNVAIVGIRSLAY